MYAFVIPLNKIANLRFAQVNKIVPGVFLDILEIQSFGDGIAQFKFKL